MNVSGSYVCACRLSQHNVLNVDGKHRELKGAPPPCPKIHSSNDMAAEVR